MNRRTFLTTGGAAGLLAAQAKTVPAAASEPAKARPSGPVRMKLGDQTKPTNDAHLAYLARYGVRNICGYPDIKGDRLYATVDELKAMTDLAAKYKVTVDCLGPPFLESSFIDTEKHPAVMLAQSPERDRDIEQLQTLIRNCAQAGVPGISSSYGVPKAGKPYEPAERGLPSESRWSSEKYLRFAPKLFATF